MGEGDKSETTCAKICFHMIHLDAGMRPTTIDDRGRMCGKGTDRIGRAVECLYQMICCWENRHQHKGSFEGDNQAVVPLREHRRPCWLTLCLSHWATLCLVRYSLITHTARISGTHGFVYASAHPNGTWQPPPPATLSLSLSKRMDRLTLPAAWHYSGPHFPFWDAWPNTAPSSPRSESLPASTDNTSSQHITEMTEGLWWSDAWAGLLAVRPNLSLNAFSTKPLNNDNCLK